MEEKQSNLITISSKFHKLINREIPTVFVKMDLPIGYSISKTIQNVPFIAITTDDGIHIRHHHGWQILLEPAFATTTHKTQGTTAKFGDVIDPSEKKHSQEIWTMSQLHDQQN